MNAKKEYDDVRVLVGDTDDASKTSKQSKQRNSEGAPPSNNTTTNRNSKKTVGSLIVDGPVAGPYSFSSLLNANDSSSKFSVPGGDVFSELMLKEERVIDNVNRVVNHARLTDLSKRSFVQQPLHVILVKLVETIRFIIEDIVSSSHKVSISGTKGIPAYSRAIVHSFVGGERKIYVGIILISLAVTFVVFHLAF